MSTFRTCPRCKEFVATDGYVDHYLACRPATVIEAPPEPAPASIVRPDFDAALTDRDRIMLIHYRIKP